MNANDYTHIAQQVATHCWQDTRYTRPVSVIIPVYNRCQMLARTLAGLCHQTYPGELIEAVIADDGSADDVASVLDRYAPRLNLVYTRQPDEGYRLAAARNMGIRAAQHADIVLLDADVIPVARFIEELMRYLHLSSEVCPLGIRHFVDADGISDADILRDGTYLDRLPRTRSKNPIFDRYRERRYTVDWRLAEYERTDHLKTSAHPFRCLVGAAAAFPRWAFEQVGGFCEDFRHWGGEDAEFGFRLFNEGVYFIPVNRAVGLHQEPPDGGPVDRRADKTHTDPFLRRKCPLHFRKEPLTGDDSVPHTSWILFDPDLDAAHRLRAELASQGSDCELVYVDPIHRRGWRWRNGSKSDSLCLKALPTINALVAEIRGVYCRWIEASETDRRDFPRGVLARELRKQSRDIPLDPRSFAKLIGDS